MVGKLVVLFGKSGYGKSSLINAGLLPDIAKEAVPIVVRLGSYVAGQMQSPLDNLRSAIDEVLTNNLEADFIEKLDVPTSLWHQLKRKQSRRQRRFVFIFDQFEEFFTYPLPDQQAFKEQLAGLLYTEVPQAVRNITEKLTPEQQTFIAATFDAKVLFSIRADRMSLLDSMKDKLPAILQKRYELKGLSEKQAKDAIEKPARLVNPQFATPPFEYTPQAIDKIIGELSNYKTKAIEAFQIQIVCDEIEKTVEKGQIPDRDQNGLPDVDIENLPDFNNLYENYYHRKITELDPAIQNAAQLLIEEELIFEDPKTGEARRLSVDSGVLLHELSINQTLLNQLESTFLLRRESTSTGGFNYEVSHDTMIAPILKSKAKRKALEKEEQEKLEAKRKQRRLFAILAAAILAFLIILGIVLYVLKLKNEADIAKDDAIKAKNEAITERDNARKALEDKEIAELETIFLRVNSILDSSTPNCPAENDIKLIFTMRKKYPNNNKLEQKVKDINLKNERKSCKYQ
ncbi:MAG: hypothetical protein HC817_02995 [Saprospiraceae bacterium]|nr:hypothetical protein [Saprospiraceae bacterium]